MTDLILRIFVRDHKNTEDPAVRDKCGRVAGAVGIVTNFLLFLMKIIVGTVFHSVSVTADAVNNLTDSGSSVVTLIGFKMASKPADEKHPFGHARIEYLSGVIVSFIVIFLGLQLGMSSIEKILTPEENALTPVALVVLVISILAKLWQCLFYRKVGRMIKSESVEATSKDSRNDVIATSVVLLGAVITMLTGVNLDGYMGAAVALFIVFSGVQLTISTADPLLGQAPEGELVQTITEKCSRTPASSACMTLLCTTTAWAAVLPLPIVRSMPKTTFSSATISSITSSAISAMTSVSTWLFTLTPLLSAMPAPMRCTAKCSRSLPRCTPPSPFTISASSGALRTVISCSTLPCRSR